VTSGRNRRACNGIVALIALASVLVLGCGRPPNRDAASDTSRRLLPTELPDLSRMAKPVQEQLQAQHDALRRAQADPAISSVDLAAAYGALGTLFLAAESFDDAVPCYQNAHTLAPNDFRWSYYLGHAYRLEGESAKAASFFERTLEARPDDVAALVWLGNLYLDQGRTGEAGQQFSKALTLQPRTAAAELGLGRIALASRDYGSAVDHLERSLALDRRASVAHYPLATAYRALGKTEQAEAHLRLRGDVEIGPPDPLLQEMSGALHSPVALESRGDRAIAAGEFAAAVSHFQRALDLAPDSLTLRQKLATARSLTGDVAGALNEFQDVLRRSPDFAAARYSIGVLLLADGQLDLAIDQFSAAVKSDSTYVQARLQLANALRRRGRFESAMRQYGDVIGMDPRLGEARFGQAIALAELKRYPDARVRLEEAMRLFPDRPEFVDALARLLATAADSRARDGARARELARSLVKHATVESRETMAMALAELGEFEEALRWQREAIGAADSGGQHDLAARMNDNLRLYQAHRPCRTAWRDDPRWNSP
jgi:tetratricopeptide (TPR) repeat protein